MCVNVKREMVEDTELILNSICFLLKACQYLLVSLLPTNQMLLFKHNSK